MSRVLLIDVDSKIPNIALMKISGYHRMNGDVVGFDVSDPDMVYASVIFTKNKHKTDGLKAFYPKANINIGGSGYNLKKKLPVEIEYLAPTDYSLYSDCDSYYGFTTRGCIRKCYFCVVPKKEGKFRVERSVESIVSDEKMTYYGRYVEPNNLGIPPGGYRKITLFDNNILSDKNWFMEVTKHIIDRGLNVDFNQGLDIRLLDNDVAHRLKELKPISIWRFAFDDLSYKHDVLHGLEILEEEGISSRRDCQFYVYMHNDADFDSALERCNILREHNTQAYIMINGDLPASERTQRMRDLARWCRPWIFWDSQFSEYKKKPEFRGQSTLEEVISDGE